LTHSESISATAEFAAPASRVWDLLMDWAAIIDWMPSGFIQSLEMEGEGIGAIRHLVTGKGVLVSERLDRADQLNGILELSLVEPLPWGLLSYRASGKLESLADGRSRLDWRGTLEMPERGEELDRTVRLLKKSYANMLLGIRQAVES
jgi:hypothetical protein